MAVVLKALWANRSAASVELFCALLAIGAEGARMLNEMKKESARVNGRSFRIADFLELNFRERQAEAGRERYTCKARRRSRAKLRSRAINNLASDRSFTPLPFKLLLRMEAAGSHKATRSVKALAMEERPARSLSAGLRSPSRFDRKGSGSLQLTRAVAQSQRRLLRLQIQDEHGSVPAYRVANARAVFHSQAGDGESRAPLPGACFRMLRLRALCSRVGALRRA